MLVYKGGNYAKFRSKPRVAGFQNGSRLEARVLASDSWRPLDFTSRQVEQSLRSRHTAGEGSSFSKVPLEPPTPFIQIFRVRIAQQRNYAAGYHNIQLD